MTKFIIMLSGKQRSGKDSVAEFLLKLEYKRVAFADVLKQEVAEAYGLSLMDLEILKNSTAEYRGLLIAWAKCRTLKEPIYFVRKALKGSMKPGNVVITDFRFQKEVDTVRAEFPDAEAITLRIECDEDIRATRGTISNSTDASETALDDYEFDHVITNNGTLEDLTDKVYGIICNYELRNL